MDCNNDARWTVYIHIVPKELTGYQFDKYYVGITSNTPENRWRHDGVGYKRNVYFMNAINKYGWDNITHKIIAKHLTHDEACKMEMDLIKELKSNDRVHGYNLTDGGDGVSGYKFTEEQYLKILGKTGDKNPFYGKRHSEETRQKMRENHADLSGSKNGRAKPIYVFKIDGMHIGTYPSTVEAAKDLSIKNCIASSASHKVSYQGYLFAREKDVVFEDENIYLKNIEEYRIVQKTRNRKNRGKIVYLDKNFNVINIYENVSDAHRNTGISASTIIYQADNKNISINGNLWRWENDVKID